jgi:MFS family permease
MAKRRQRSTGTDHTCCHFVLLGCVSSTSLFSYVADSHEASAMYGYDSAFIGGTLSLPAFQRTFGLASASANERAALSSNIVSTFQAGAFFGCAFGFPIAERWGRKAALLVSAVIFIIGAGLQLIGSLGPLYAGRALTGLGVGASAMVMPIYVSECAPPLIRGRLVGVFEVMLQVALVFGFWVNYGVNKNVSSATSKQWRIPVAIQFVPAGLLILSSVFMVESPRWLVSKNRSHDAQAALSWVRGLPQEHRYIQKELTIIETGVNQELELTGGKRNFKHLVQELTRKGIRNRLGIAFGLMVFQNMTG